MEVVQVERVELLFSYGTLQLEPVQRATFGRLLSGRADALPGYQMAWLTVTDAEVVRTSGQDQHPVVSRTGRSTDRVTGTVFRISPEELKRADEYEVADYRRIRVTLASGRHAWVYVDVHSASGHE